MLDPELQRQHNPLLSFKVELSTYTYNTYIHAYKHTYIPTYLDAYTHVYACLYIYILLIYSYICAHHA